MFLDNDIISETANFLSTPFILKSFSVTKDLSVEEPLLTSYSETVYKLLSYSNTTTYFPSSILLNMYFPWAMKIELLD